VFAGAYELPAALYQEDPKQAVEFLNACTNGFARSVVDRVWEVGDEIRLKYVSGFQARSPLE
jgi:hypothetical protein